MTQATLYSYTVTVTFHTQISFSWSGTAHRDQLLGRAIAGGITGMILALALAVGALVTLCYYCGKKYRNSCVLIRNRNLINEFMLRYLIV